MKKKLNIVLIVVVISLWGSVGYKFINNNIIINNDTISASNNYTNLKKLTVKRDTFLLTPLERDPFLNKMIVTIKPSIPKKYIKPKKVEANQSRTLVYNPWPVIKYFGYIKSAKNSEMALIKVNNNLLRMHKNESQNNITILNIYKDSISIKYNKETKIFMHN